MVYQTRIHEALQVIEEKFGTLVPDNVSAPFEKIPRPFFGKPSLRALRVRAARLGIEFQEVIGPEGAPKGFLKRNPSYDAELGHQAVVGSETVLDDAA